jgi:hypothetical protein
MGKRIISDLNQFDFSQKIIDFEKLVWMWVITPAEVREEIWYDAINDENMNKLLIKQWYELLEDVWVNEIQQIPNNI